MLQLFLPLSPALKEDVENPNVNQMLETNPNLMKELKTATPHLTSNIPLILRREGFVKTWIKLLTKERFQKRDL